MHPPIFRGNTSLVSLTRGYPSFGTDRRFEKLAMTSGSSTLIQGSGGSLYLCPPGGQHSQHLGERTRGSLSCIYVSSLGLQLPRSSTCSSSPRQVVGVVKQSPPPRRRPRFEGGTANRTTGPSQRGWEDGEGRNDGPKRS